jgi:hypothetical protein
MEGCSSRLEQVEDRISEFEDEMELKWKTEENEILSFASKWMELEKIILSEVR